MSTQSLDGRIVLITGASSGIGAATARILAGRGATVICAARRRDRLDRLCKEIEDVGGNARAVALDVTDRDLVERAVATVSTEFGPVDILVNNAGVMPLSLMRDRRVDDWDRMIDVNVKGVLYCAAAVLPAMIERRAGHIVNVGSVAGRRPFPGGCVYSATKFAVRALSAGLRLELSPSEYIRVTDIEPGVVATELTDHIPDVSIRERFRTT